MQLMSSRAVRALACCSVVALTAGFVHAAVEEPIDSRFVRAQPDPFRGDYQGTPGFVAQVVATDGGKYRINILPAFDQPNAKAIAVLLGTRSGNKMSLNADGWSGTIADGKMSLKGQSQQIELEHVVRSSPTMGAKPPAGAVVLFDGTSTDMWATKDGKNWTTALPGPASAKIVDGALETIPGTGGGIITKKQFGDMHLHVEYRTLGAPTNSGVFLQTRFEVDIGENYGNLDGSASANLGNCTPPEARPRVRASHPVLEWNTLDVDYKAPRFGADGKKTESAWATVYLNGAKLFDHQEVQPTKGAAGRLGEAALGPLYLQEHGMPVQFRNIWLVEQPMSGAPVPIGAVGYDPSQPDAPAADAKDKGEKGEKKGHKGGKGGKKGGGAKGSNGEKTPKGTIPGGKVVEVVPANTSGPFIHPGVIVNKLQLAEVKRRVKKGVEPQKSAFAMLKADKLGALDYTPHPWETVECGPFSKPDLGCKDEQADSEAAYAQALLWAITGNKAYAENAVKIMNAWSAKLKGGHTNANGPVQAAWTGEVWPRAAEIIRYSYKGWSKADIERFRTMLKEQYVPTLLEGSGENGNKELAQSEALINIGVFNDDRTVFNAGLDMFRGRAPATIYLTSDGPAPLQPAKWGPAIWGNKGFIPPLVDGLEQETARDSGHAALALAAMAGAAETARQQGVDLYGELGERIPAALEYQAQYLPPNNVPAPENLEFGLHPTWAMAYNHYHDRMRKDLPKMKAVLDAMGPTGANHMMNWETLTHGGIGAVGLPKVRTP
jgi:hypothetical protein